MAALRKIAMSVGGGGGLLAYLETFARFVAAANRNAGANPREEHAGIAERAAPSIPSCSRCDVIGRTRRSHVEGARAGGERASHLSSPSWRRLIYPA